MTAARPHLQPISDREAAELVELIAGITRGEREAIGRFFDRYQREVNRLVWTMLGADADHDDLVNEAFEAMLKKIATLRIPGAMYGWVRQITVNTVRMELRRRRWRFFVSSGDDGALEHPDLSVPDEQARERLRQLYAALARLKPDDRMMVVLRHLEGLELTELAETLGCSVSTLKRHLARAEERLARALGKGEA